MGKHVVEELPGAIVLYSDGTVERPPKMYCPPLPFSKDIELQGHLQARIFLPSSCSHAHSCAQKVPVVLHFHGGGWCLLSAFSPEISAYCALMANESDSIWISVEYRLAPEHRLPAAFDDCFAALLWLQAQAVAIEEMERKAAELEGKVVGIVEEREGKVVETVEEREGKVTELDEESEMGKVRVDPWLRAHADFSRCFLAGESAGGAITQVVAARAASSSSSLYPLTLRGVLSLHPSVLLRRPTSGPTTIPGLLNEEASDTFTRLALPPGAWYGHPLVNPLANPKFPELKLPPSIIAADDGDILFENILSYYDGLRDLGHDAELITSKGLGHVFFTKQLEEENSKAFRRQIVDFMKCHQN